MVMDLVQALVRRLRDTWQGTQPGGARISSVGYIGCPPARAQGGIESQLCPPWPAAECGLEQSVGCLSLWREGRFVIEARGFMNSVWAEGRGASCKGR